MLNTAVFSAFGAAVTRVTREENEGVTTPEAVKAAQNQTLSENVTPVTCVTPENSNGWDEEDWQCAFNERAAILEYDAGMIRPAAEAMAQREISEQRSRI